MLSAHLDELEREYLALLSAPGGLRLFTEDIWPILEPGTPFYPNWHLDCIADHLEAVTFGHINHLIVTIPPRHMKSLSVAVSWPCWEWGAAAAPAYTPAGVPLVADLMRPLADYETDAERRLARLARLPSLKWMFASYAQRLSERDSQKRRQVLHSPYYRARWGHLFTIGEEDFLTDGAVKYENSRRGYHLATSVKGTATGEGGDRIVIDDPIKVDDADSDVIREGVNDWHDHTMTTRRNDPTIAAEVIIMQRTHERDLVGHLLEKVGDRVNTAGTELVLLSIPTEYEGQKYFFLGQDPRTREGELLWPTRFNAAEVARIKLQLREVAFSAQHQQRPSPATGASFKAEWLRFYAPPHSPLVGRLDIDDPTVRDLKKGTGGHLVTPLVDLRHRVQAVDAAFKEMSDSDYVAMQVWGQPHLGSPLFYLLDNVNERLSFTKTLKGIADQRRRWPNIAALLIEDKANGPAIIDVLQDKFHGVIGVPADVSKEARAAATHPSWEAGQVFLPHPALVPWVAAFVRQLLAFPFSPYDDMVDAAVHAINHGRAVEVFDEDMFAQVDIG